MRAIRFILLLPATILLFVAMIISERRRLKEHDPECDFAKYFMENNQEFAFAISEYIIQHSIHIWTGSIIFWSLMVLLIIK